MDKFKGLKGLGPIGRTIATIITVLTTNWGIVVSVGLGLVAAAINGFYRIASDPHVQVGIGTFVAALWTYIGFIVIVDRRKPRIMRPVQDYSYGLTFEGCNANYAPQSEDALQFGLLLRNYSSGPLRYHIEKFQVLIGDRTTPIGKPQRATNFMPRGGGRIYKAAPFKKDSLKEFFGKKTMGRADFIIAYGHPEQPPVRRLKMTLELALEFKEDGSQLGFADCIIEESDEPITAVGISC